MFAVALIVFREVLEAALVVTIVMAATRGLPHRGKWISLGITGGVVGAMIVAALARALASLFQGAGQEIVNAAILFIAVILISWHVVWMNSHGRKMAASMKKMGQSVLEGERHMSVLAIVVGLAVMREGSEIVLILQGLWSTGSMVMMIGGASLGLFAGILMGGLIYAGFLALSIQRVFTLTNSILVLIAAGMAARAANFLAQAELLPSLGSHMWDTSRFLSDESLTGQTLATLIGYIARPNGIEVLFYVLTLMIVLALMVIARHRTLQNLRAVAFIAIFLTSTPLLHPPKAYADEVLSPYVEQGELEVEQQGYVSHDRNINNSDNQDLETEFGYSPTSFWRTELEGEFERVSGTDQNLRYQSFNSENTFQLAEAGEYWIDPGFYYEMDFSRQGTPNSIITGFLGAKTIGDFAETFNLLIQKDYGPGNTPLGFIYSNQAKYRFLPWLEPGFEIYGDTGGVDKFSQQQLAVGPGLFGKFHLGEAQELKYEVAYLFGATEASPDGAVRWKFEYEFFF